MRARTCHKDTNGCTCDGAINKTFKPSLAEKRLDNVYTTLARPVMSYEAEAWMIMKAREKVLTASQLNV
jgi:hypothetical protein